MHVQKKAWFVINVLGGVAVLGSYAHGLLTHPDQRDALWGSIPEELRAVYGVTMWLAALGYFLFSYYFVFRIRPAEVRIGESFGFGAVNALYVLVLVPSALWLPLTFAYLAEPSRELWLAIRVDLFLVGIGAVGLMLALFALRPRPSGVSGALAVLGLLLFCLQTAFLDAFVWPAFFVAG